MFKDRIRNGYAQFSPGFRRLADFILNHTLEAALLTATELAQRLEVDPATVVRFAQELGYTGYRELSQEIKQYIHEHITAPRQLPDMDSKASEATEEQRLAAQIQGIYQPLQYLSPADLRLLEEIGATLNAVPAVWITAEGSAIHLGRAFAQELQNLGLAAEAFESNLLDMAMYLEQVQAGDALLALGHEGPQLNLSHVLRLGQAKGGRTLCISSNGMQAAAREAQLTLAFALGAPSAMSGLALIAAVLAAIANMISQQRKESLQQQEELRQKYLQQLVELRQQGDADPGLALAIWSQILSRANRPPIL